MVAVVGDVVVVVEQALQADEDEAEELNLRPFALLDEEQLEHYLISLCVGLVDD